MLSTERIYQDVMKILQDQSSLDEVGPLLKEGSSRQEPRALVDKIKLAARCLTYPLEQNPSKIPTKTREAALQALVQGKNPFNEGTFGKILGCGVYGVVKKFKVNRQVFAAKLDLGSDIEMLNREYRFLVNFDHPNIIKVMHAAEQMLCLEYAEKGCLDIENPPAKLNQVMVQVMRGLHYLHGNQCAHRDIKPSNLLVMSDGVIKIADLGLMVKFKDFKLNKDLNYSQTFHLSPEYRLCTMRNKDCLKTDIWAVGWLISLFLLKDSSPRFLCSMKEVKKFSGFTEKDYARRFSVRKLKQHDPTGILQKMLKSCFEFLPKKRPVTAPLLEILEKSIE